MPFKVNGDDGVIVDDGGDGGCGYVEMPSAFCSSVDQLSTLEIAKIRRILNNNNNSINRHDTFRQPQQQQQQQRRLMLEAKASVDSDETEFRKSTHAWCVSKEIDTNRPEKEMDRIIGAIIIGFQMFTYFLFAAEAIEDYQIGRVEVTTTHDYCLASDFAPQENFTCEAEKTYLGDAFVSFFMLGIFLAADVQQAIRSIYKAKSKSWLALAFAIFVALEVFCAFLAASISISQKLYIGEVTDAIEAGVGLLFIRELSTRAFRGMRKKKKKAYKSFFFVLFIIIGLGMLVHPVCETMIAP